jgi:hypothetical protein
MVVTSDFRCPRIRSTPAQTNLESLASIPIFQRGATSLHAWIEFNRENLERLRRRMTGNPHLNRS